MIRRLGTLEQHRQPRHRTLLSHGDAAAQRQGAGAGGDNNGGYLSSAELYDPATGRWSSDRQPRHRTRRHTATLLPNGKVLVAGGER